MGLGDLFKSKKERERETERKRRKAVRNADRVVGDVKRDITKMEKEKAQAWTDARQFLKEGQKDASRRKLQTVRAMELQIVKLEKRRWTFEQVGRKLKNASVDQQISASLGELADSIHIDPDTLAEGLANTEDKLMDLVDNDRIWESAYDKEMEGVETSEEQMIPSFEEMEKLLADEAAVDIGGERESVSGDKELKEKIDEGRERLKGLLEEDKK
jgi:hypothetical protein